MVAAVLMAQPGGAVAKAPPGEAAVAVLLQQASFWDAQGRADRARISLQRALLLEPANPDALAALAALDRPAAALDEARRLAREGRDDQAVAQYDRIFLDRAPPPDLAVEYFRTLGRAAGGWEAGRDGLAALVRQTPADPAAQLAYAEILTRRAGSRDQGLEQLRRLAQTPEMADAATTAWRAALAWLPDTPDSVSEILAFLAIHPDDAAVKARLATARQPPGAAPLAKARGFDLLGAGLLAEAARSFEETLAARPDDAEAVGGLGVVRLRQGDLAAARALLSRARAGDPDHVDRWSRALALAVPPPGPNPAVALLARGANAAAARELRTRIGAGDPDPDLPLMLADAQARLSERPAAEQTLRQAIARRPGDGRALVALAGLLDGEGRSRDAADLLTQAVAAGAGALVAEGRAQLLRTQAEAAGDPALRVALLDAAAATAPGDDWIRLDLARALARAGRTGEARSTMARATGDAATGDAATAEALRVGAIFARETDDPATAAALLARLPQSGRPPDMRAARAQPDLAISPDALASLAYADALRGSGKAAGARWLVADLSESLPRRRQPDVPAPMLTRTPAAPQRNLALARLYQGAARPNEALALAEGLLHRDPADAEARRLAVDAALATGERGRATALTRAGLQLLPLDPHAWLAAADLARARGDRDTELRALRRARALRTRQLAAQDAGSAPATVLAVISPEDLSAPPLPVLSPDAGSAPETDNAIETDEDGDRVFVRRRMLDTDVSELPPPVAPPAEVGMAARPAASPVSARPPVPVVMGASLSSPEGLPANPFRTDADRAAPAADPPSPMLADLQAPATAIDPMTGRIDRDIAALADPASPDPWLPGAQAAAGFRGRSGSPGTSQLAEVTVPLEADLSDGGSGRIRLAATPTYLDSGSVANGAATRAQFGSLALGLRPTSPGIASQDATGAALDLGYSIGDFAADVGSTPLGFRQQNAVGGVEWAPTLADGVRLRLTGERRAVTDSLLSYAGTRDPQTGQGWGGVTYASGHADLEFSSGPLDLYVGGGGGVLDGQDVRSNSEAEAGAGGSLPLWQTPSQEMRLGVDLVYYGFERNLSGFTLGQGGYFSPRSYFAALFPLTFKDRPTEDLTYELGGAAGVQTWRRDSSPTFPNNSDLQSALEAQQANPATAVAGVNTAIPSKSQTGFAGGAHGSIDYRLTGGFHIGARADYQHTGDYNEAVGLIYGRYVFNAASP